MAETGPCGPTSEIHWDKHPELGEDGIIDSLVAEDDRFLELWNLVFMQFNRTQADPAHSGDYDEPLPSPGVDTGMGFERIVSVLQGVETNYDTDLFTDIMDATQEYLGHSNQFRQDNYVAYRVIADHCRAAAFLIADGVNPGTTGREYITRMLIRRALRFAHGMNVDKPFMVDVANEVINKMGGVYPELVQFQEAIRYQIGTEEERFTRTLDQSLAVLEVEIGQMKAHGIKMMDGKTAFFLFATHGLPLEITRDLLKEHGLSVDEAGFAVEMEKHREASTQDKGGFDDVGIYQDVLRSLQESGALGEEGVHYNPYDYDHLTFENAVLAIIKDGERVEKAQKGDPVEVVLADTTFYVESGGQVSDMGSIRGGGWEVRVDGMGMPVGGLIVHRGEVIKGAVEEGSTATGSVDAARRWDIMRNHTATHLLHASLRNVLGKHVRQKGSLVAPDRLRFDFTHNAPLTTEEIRAISDEVNAMVLANEPLDIIEKTLDEAKREGAMALFGEKYGQTVRTITIEEPHEHDRRFSYELCGGTHVRTTAEIGPVVITREESSSAGVRRIEAVSGRGALALMQQRMDTLGSAAAILGTDLDMVDEKAGELVEELREAHRLIERMEADSAKGSLDDLLAQAKEIDGVTIVAAQVDAPDGDLLGQMADWCRDRISSGVVMLGSEIEGKVRLVAKVTPDLIERGVHAGKIVGAAAKIVGGGGGGRPDFATAGGKDISKLPEAVAKVEELVAEAVG